MSFRYDPRFGIGPIDPDKCCAGVRNPDGLKGSRKQCARKRQPGSEWCALHDPARVEARHERQRQEAEARWEQERIERQRLADAVAIGEVAMAYGIKDAGAMRELLEHLGMTEVER